LIFKIKLIIDDENNKIQNKITKNLFTISLSKKMKKDFISIIIPYHKKKIYFQDTINSIIKQTYTNYELVVIYDDQDKSELKYVRSVLNNIKGKKIKLIVNKKNIGVGPSRNKAIKSAKGNYIAFCDADDKWKINKLDYQLKFMKKNNLQFCHSSYDIINKFSNKIGEFQVKPILIYNDLIQSCDIGLSSVMISKKLMKNYFFSKLKTKEDYLLWIKIIKSIKRFRGIRKKLISWRYLDKSLSSSNKQKVFDAFRLYKNHLNFSYFETLICVFRLSLNSIIKKKNIYS
tara:strand:- start:1289 stop:2152 length:864 start_codon:yes stop_codon:yes gene_type:complete